jgi:hypothetical protein
MRSAVVWTCCTRSWTSCTRSRTFCVTVSIRSKASTYGLLSLN